MPPGRNVPGGFLYYLAMIGDAPLLMKVANGRSLLLIQPANALSVCTIVDRRCDNRLSIRSTISRPASRVRPIRATVRRGITQFLAIPQKVIGRLLSTQSPIPPCVTPYSQRVHHVVLKEAKILLPCSLRHARIQKPSMTNCGCCGAYR